MATATAQRPMTQVELTAAKYKLLQQFRDPQHPMNDAVLLEMFGETLHKAADTTKLSLTASDNTFQPGKMATFSGGEFAFSDIAGWNERLADPSAYPLGGMQVGKSIDRIHTKDILDSTATSGGLLIPQGIVPTLWVWLVTRFQAWQQIPRVPANGVNHSWRNLIALGDSTDGYIDEYGCPPANRSVITSGSTNIAIMAFKRGISLKFELLAQQIGFRFDGNLPLERELQNAMISRARILEKTFYQGTTASGHNGTDEYGQSFINGFNGLRALLSNTTLANGLNNGFYPAGFSPVLAEQATTGATPITDALNLAVAQVYNNGGMPNAIHITASTALKIAKENSPNVRYTMDEVRNGLTVGATLNGLASTVAGFIPFTVVPDQSIGSYPVNSIAGTGGATLMTAGQTVVDAYVLSTNDLAFPYIGSPDPMPIEVPIGTFTPEGACLVRDLIIYLMIGFACYVPVHQAKVRTYQ